MGSARAPRQVVAPQPRNPPCVTEILDSRLQHSLERHQPGERERRKQNETEGVEGCAHATSRCDQTQGDQTTGDGPDEHRRSSSRLRDVLPSTLEREMLVVANDRRRVRGSRTRSTSRSPGMVSRLLRYWRPGPSLYHRPRIALPAPGRGTFRLRRSRPPSTIEQGDACGMSSPLADHIEVVTAGARSPTGGSVKVRIGSVRRDRPEERRDRIRPEHIAAAAACAGPLLRRSPRARRRRRSRTPIRIGEAARARPGGG